MQGPAETTQSTERTLADLRKLAAERNWDRLESVWMDALENPQQAAQHLTGFLDVAEVILSSPKDASRAGPLLELLLPVSTDSAPPQQVLRIYAGLVRAYPSKKDYRAAFAERFERLHPLASPERVFYEASGFATHQNPAAALSRLEKLLRFREGAYVVHASGWGVGKVLAVDPFLKQVRVDLEHKKDHRIAIDAVDSILEPLPPDSFLALSHEGGAELRRLREEDPVRLVSMLLDTFGNPLALKDIKSRLVPAVIEPSGWNKWWNRVKGALRDTGVFRVGDRAPYTVERLQLAVSYEDELVHTFLRAEWPQARQIARLVARRNANELENAWQKIRERLLSVSNSSGGRGVNVIEAALIIDRGDGGKSKDFLRSILARFSSQDLSTVFQELSGAEEQRRAVESLPDTRPDDWEEITSTLFAGKKDTLRDAAVDLLEKRCPEKIQSLLKDLVKNPKASPEAFCFMLQSHIEGSSHSSLEVFRSRGPRELLVLVTDLLDHLQHLAERRGRLSYKEIVRRVEDILGQGDRRFFLDGLKAMSSEDRRDLYTRLVRNESLLPQLKGALLQCILEAEPSLVQEKELPPWEEDCIYVTAAGLEKRKDEFREIMEVKLPKVFEDVGRAAAFGDLSENAEYTSALEERDSLTKRATKIKAELDKATIIVPDMVRKDRAGLGSRIHLVNLRTGDKFVYSVLGPWDGSPEDGILNYLSPLGRLFHGRTEGEEVEAQLPGGTEMYKLAKIGSHFEKDS